MAESTEQFKGPIPDREAGSGRPQLLEAVDAYLTALAILRDAIEAGATGPRLSAMAAHAGLGEIGDAIAHLIGPQVAVTRKGYAFSTAPAPDGSPCFTVVRISQDLDLVAELIEDDRYTSKALTLAAHLSAGDPLDVEQLRWLAGAICFASEAELSAAISAVTRRPEAPAPRDWAEFTRWAEVVLRDHESSPRAGIGPGAHEPSGPIGPDRGPSHPDAAAPEVNEGID